MQNSDHFRTRMQQRGITSEVVDIMVKYGKRSYTSKGVSFAMDKKSRVKARADLGESQYKRLAKKFNIYVIGSVDGEIGITVAHRYHRRRMR